jgi:hypothetical protein
MKGIAMNRIITFLVTVIFSIHTFYMDIVSVFAQSRKPVMGMLTLEARGGLSAEEAAIISDRLQEHLVQTGIFEIVERGKITEILNEQGFQQSGVCNTAECAVEVGKIIGAEQMVAGSIGKVGKIFSFAVRVFDVGTSRIVKVVSRDYEGQIEKLLTQVARDIAREIAGLPPVREGGKGWVWAVVGGILVAGGGSAAVILRGQTKTSGPSEIPLPPAHP